MPNLQPLPANSNISAQRYLHIVNQAWRQTQGRVPRAALHDDQGRAAEGGRSGGRIQDLPGPRFALHLLQGLRQAGCRDIDDALRAAGALGDI
ncbi:hypothetical protein [Roseicella aquatilis]|uniref:Uncharacterized protein n=1 Tax=Roseicella aquatilis TaxID=2527868 RepID=A0A4R4DY56_9PROT|nr:hypothetical protein [Roseicella aquatilis]TCZ66005.1 hypothetical protein EXY23_02675 [Roseicella aquatilis]